MAREQKTVRVADQSELKTVMMVLGNRTLRRTGIKCAAAAFYYFFFLQYRAALLPGRIPVSRVDHPLDRKIPFTPAWVAVYLDFVTLWIRMLGFLLTHYRRRALGPAADFIRTMGELYKFAAEVYSKNLSTTNRPRYYKQPRFVLIHLADPHLMCIPSLHVMVVIRTYTSFRAILRSLGAEGNFAPQIEEIRRRALAITEAILLVKQHSVNCIPAAMYAMTCFDRPRFPPGEAEDFASRLFTGSGALPQGEAVRDHIITLYRRFLSEGPPGRSWEFPLLSFLSTQPAAPRTTGGSKKNHFQNN